MVFFPFRMPLFSLTSFFLLGEKENNSPFESQAGGMPRPRTYALTSCLVFTITAHMLSPHTWYSRSQHICSHLMPGIHDHSTYALTSCLVFTITAHMLSPHTWYSRSQHICSHLMPGIHDHAHMLSPHAWYSRSQHICSHLMPGIHDHSTYALTSCLVFTITAHMLSPHLCNQKP